MPHQLLAVALILAVTASASAQLPEPSLNSPFIALDLNLGETQEATLANGRKVTVKLLALTEERDSLRIQALMIAGRMGEAKQRLAEFRKRRPKSLFLPALEAALGE